MAFRLPLDTPRVRNDGAEIARLRAETEYWHQRCVALENKLADFVEGEGRWIEFEHNGRKKICQAETKSED